MGVRFWGAKQAGKLETCPKYSIQKKDHCGPLYMWTRLKKGPHHGDSYVFYEFIPLSSVFLSVAYTTGPKTEDLCRLCQGGWERGTPSAQVRSRPHRVPGFQYQVGVQTRKVARGSTWCQEGKKVDKSKAVFGFAPWLHHACVGPASKGDNLETFCSMCKWPRQPRWIQDPELPDDEEEKLFFTMINLDMSNITEVRRLTKLEMEGCIDQAGLDEFVKAFPISHIKSIKCRWDNASSARTNWKNYYVYICFTIEQCSGPYSITLVDREMDYMIIPQKSG